MAEFKVTVETDRAKETYRIHSNRRDDKCTHVAWQAIRSFEQHGHAKAPYEDGPLTLHVVAEPEGERPLLKSNREGSDARTSEFLAEYREPEGER